MALLWQRSPFILLLVIQSNNNTFKFSQLQGLFQDINEIHFRILVLRYWNYYSYVVIKTKTTNIRGFLDLTLMAILGILGSSASQIVCLSLYDHWRTLCINRPLRSPLHPTEWYLAFSVLPFRVITARRASSIFRNQADFCRNWDIFLIASCFSCKRHMPAH